MTNEREVDRLREALKDITAHLTAAVSLLERTPKAKKAAASDKMFAIMLNDYRTSAERGRAALLPGDAGENTTEER